MVHDARDAILVQDLTGKVLAWNPGAARIYGWSEAEALAMNIRALIPKDERESALAVIQRLSEVENLEPQVTRRIAKDGKDLRVSMIASPLVNDAGETYAIATTERVMAS